MNDAGDDLLIRPIIIVGAPRSGTTFLGSILESHPDLAYVVEPRLTWRYGNDAKSDMLKPGEARPEVCAHIRRSFAKVVRAAGRRRLLEKTPSNALRLGFVDRVLPGCQFVHILRDGVQSILSIRNYWRAHASGIKPHKMIERLSEIDVRRAPRYAKEMIRRVLPRRLARWTGQPVWGPRLPGIEGLLRDLDLLEVCCLQWRMCVEAACYYGRQLPSDRYMECRLEAMSVESIRSILDFCGLEECESVWQTFHSTFDPALPGGRAIEARSEEIALIKQWIQPTLEWLDYASQEPLPGPALAEGESRG